MNLVNMALPKETGKGGCCCCEGPEAVCSCENDQPKYPWGLRVNLESEQLQALGMTALPAVGSTMNCACQCKVVSVSQCEEQDGTESRVELQIVAMGMQNVGSNKPTAAILYGTEGGE